MKLRRLIFLVLANIAFFAWLSTQENDLSQKNPNPDDVTDKSKSVIDSIKIPDTTSKLPHPQKF